MAEENSYMEAVKIGRALAEERVKNTLKAHQTLSETNKMSSLARVFKNNLIKKYKNTEGKLSLDDLLQFIYLYLQESSLIQSSRIRYSPEEKKERITNWFDNFVKPLLKEFDPEDVQVKKAVNICLRISSKRIITHLKLKGGNRTKKNMSGGKRKTQSFFSLFSILE